MTGGPVSPRAEDVSSADRCEQYPQPRDGDCRSRATRSRTGSHLVSTAYGWSVAHEPNEWPPEHSLRRVITALALCGRLGGAGASPAITNGEGNPVDASAGRACSRIGRRVAVTGAIERLVLGDATHGTCRPSRHPDQWHRPASPGRPGSSTPRCCPVHWAAGSPRLSRPVKTVRHCPRWRPWPLRPSQTADQMQARAGTVGSGPGKTAGQPS